uniref:adenylate cyclase n=1 Tax=Sinocyclocheilus rhinocerous TaxID=307959 RepID=A0A673JQ54_9TELE
MLISLSSGMTVNLASRMDSTGVSGKIQLPEETYAILNERGFAFEYRGEIYVKGISEQEGKIRTHFLLGRVQPNPLILQLTARNHKGFLKLRRMLSVHTYHNVDFRKCTETQRVHLP